MAPQRSAVFLIHLVQDVNVLRPLIFMATRDFRFSTMLLVSRRFAARDASGAWRAELRQIAGETGAEIDYFDGLWELHGRLDGEGLLISASESNLPNHATTHDVFRYAPAGYIRVTLQHGFECVGFRHSANHVRAHGSSASFAADVLCAWTHCANLSSLAPSQVPKVVVTGPTSLLQQPASLARRGSEPAGLVCENLHSVRFMQSRGVRTQFVDAFARFARLLAQDGKRVTLRPHPGGQYSISSKLELPDNVDVENAPTYRLDFRRFSYGISGPSSVLIEMLLANVPTAVWRDPQGKIDGGAYETLPTVSTPAEWEEFARAAERDPAPFLSNQVEFLRRTGMPLDPADVYRRYATLFQAAKRMEIRPPSSVAERERILFIANGDLPTLQLSFGKPLRPLTIRGEVASRLLTERELRDLESGAGQCCAEAESLKAYLNDYNPSTIVFCRYSGPTFQPVIEWARREEVPVIYHIDDDLLAVPSELGARKFAIHNSPERLASVRELLRSADLVYASTVRLKERLQRQFPTLRITSAKVYCSGTVLRRAVAGPARKVGYMASADHAHNLEPILPAIERLLDANPTIGFEFFGSIPVAERLKRFGDRISSVPPIANYDNFLNRLAGLEWDVGICPLVPIDFNMTKADTKWVEYTSAGAAVIASKGTVYDDCCSGGCGILAGSYDEWLSSLDQLINNGDERLAMVERAQAKLTEQYSDARLRKQVMDVLTDAHDLVRVRKGEQRQEESLSCQLR